MRHQDLRQTCSDLLIIHKLFPVLTNNVAKDPSPATLRAIHLVIHKESHARRGRAEKFMDKSAARGGWLRRPAVDRLAEPLRSHELSSLNQLELLLMHKETYAIKNPDDLLDFLMRVDALGQQNTCP